MARRSDALAATVGRYLTEARLRYRGSLVGRSSAAATVSWVGAGLSALLSLLLTHALGASGYGAYSYAIGWAVILMVPATLGYERLLLRDVAVLDDPAGSSQTRQLLRHTNRAVALVGTAIGILAAAIGAAALNPPFRSPFLLATVLTPLLGLIALRRGTLQAFGSPALAQVPDQIVRPIVTGLSMALVFALVSHTVAPEIAVLCAIAAGCLSLGVGHYNVRKRLAVRVPNRARGEPQPDSSSRRLSVRPAWSFMVMTAVTQLNFQIPVLVLGSLSTASQVGYYSVAATASNLMVRELAAVTVTLAPAMAQHFDRGELDRLQRVVTTGARVAFGFSVAIALVLVAFRVPLLDLFGGSFGKNASEPLLILIAGQLVNAAVGPAGMLLMMARSERAVAASITIGAALSALLCLLLVPQLDARGAAIGASVSLAAWNLCTAYLSKRRLGVNATILARARTA